MHSTLEFLAKLHQEDIKLSTDGAKLFVDAPEGVLTPELRREIGERKPMLLSLLGQPSALPSVLAAPDQRYQPFPLTDIQQAYWLGRDVALELGNVAAHFYLELEGQGLDMGRLTSAWQQLIERHDMLRAIILPDGQQQILAQVPPYQIKILDLHDQTEAEIAAQIEAVRQELSHHVLPTGQWPLFEIRATLLAEGYTRLHLSLDLLIADVWSNLILAREWAELYQQPNRSLPPLELTFRDYVLAGQKLQDNELVRRSEAYWFNRLDSLPPAPELPLAHNPNSLTQPHFTRRSAHLTLALWQQLKQRASQAGLTPSGVLLAAFAEILTAWSKSPRFTINLTLFNRLPLHPQVNEIIGDFTSLTLLEVNHSTAEPFAARASRLQQQLWQDLDHRYVSGVRVLRELSRRQGGQRVTMPVVFTSVLALGPADYNEGSIAQLGREVYGISQTPQVWLDHHVREEQGALLFNWDAVEALFPEGLLDDMFGAYCRLLEQLAGSDAAWTEPTRQLLPPAQLAQRTEVNDTAAPTSDALLHTLFIAQVAARPTQTAIIAPDRCLSYQELFDWANHLGTQLRELDAQSNTLIAVMMEKGWEQVVAVLGILMSGAAYLPIDPDLPTERRHYLLNQGQVKLALTQPWLNQSLDWPDTLHRLIIDDAELPSSIFHPPSSILHPPSSILHPPSSLFHPPSSSDLAYVIYTSGSTGLPKGVMIDHRGAVNTILDLNERFGVTSHERVLALSALSFDLSVFDIFGTLAAGGTIVMPQAHAAKDPAHWADLCRQHRVSLWNSVPALMQMLVDFLDINHLPACLRLVMLSGDWIPVILPDQIKHLWPQAELYSLGGATEASIWSIFYPIEQVEPGWASIPYGKPLRNQSFHVLNHLLEPCPVWVPGELYIGGIGLAQGYWRDEVKTGERFISQPQTGERLYKTGDLGRYLPDGNIEFLGREDFQVKIRGYRIELGEIEAALQQHPGVSEAVVTAVGQSRTQQHLVAYVVLNNLTPPDQPGEAYTPQMLEGIILDPVERLEFKLKQPGLEPTKPDQSEVQLPLPAAVAETLTQTYLARQSYRHFLPEPIPLARFSQFLSCLRQLSLPDSPLPKYRYPSAGNLYPVQTYLYIKPNRVEGLNGGFYYYHSANHRLILRHAAAELEGHLYGPNQPIFEQGTFSLFLVGQLNAIAPMYGELARDFCLLEAGYMGQLLMSLASTYQLGLCPIGYVADEAVRERLGLEASQTLLHSFVGGGIDPLQTQQIPSSAPKSEPVTVELRRYLQGKLPDYMVPASYVLLDAIPLTANGKIDRRALPAPDIIGSERPATFEPPRTPTEISLAALWADTLGLEQIGRNEDFFALGGDSLLAIQLIAKLRETFPITLPLRRLFEAPTLAGLAEQIEADLREQASSVQATVEPLPQLVPDLSQRDQPFPLTDIQQAYWLGRSGAFELSQVATHGYLELEGQGLHLERLTLAWQRLIERHDMLRAVILPDGQQQVLAQVPPYQIKTLDLRGQAEEAVSAQLEAVRQALSHQVLPAELWPLFEIRATLLDGDRTRLHFSFDMLLADGWSIFILAREWAGLYQQPDLTLPPLDLTFRDYVLAEQRLQETEWVRQSEAYWFNRLDSLPPAPELPLAHNVGALSQSQFIRRSAHLSPALWQQLKQRASQVGLTPSGVLLAAFAEILTAWSKSPRFTINLTLFNRLPLHPQVNNIVGDFTSLTLLEVDNSTLASFTTRAGRLQQQLWQDLDHRYVSGVRVLRELSRRQGGQRVTMPVVFTSTLALDTSEQSVAMLHQLGQEIYSISQTPQVWLDHQVREEQGALLFNWDAVEALFPEGLLDDMFGAYCRLLEQLAGSDAAWTEPTRQLLPPAQLAQRAEANDTAASTSDALLHTLFIAQAAARPDQTAIIAPDRCLSYQELFDRANHLGCQLRELDAQPNTLIAVVMEKGWEQVVAVLGILMSGAAYLPIDPDLPTERRHYLLEQGQVNLALTQPWLNHSLDWPDTLHRIIIDDIELPSSIFHPPSSLFHPPSPTDLAYVIYTSGSTGLPKGVMIDHRGAVNTILDLNERFGVTPQERVLALSALSFDLSVFDIFGTLAAGGTIVMPQATKDPAHWADLCRQHQVSLWNSVPALMQMLVDYLDAALPPSLRLIMLSGDWIPVTLPDQIKHLWPQVELYSLGGATEASIWSIFYPIKQVEPTWTSIPYGKPLRNQSFHVLNHLLEPCPVWGPGELYIGGLGLAQGYWRDEVKTGERFISHPRTGERLYKTGDLGRYLPDGNIEFLGREDFQVKIRGYRIELGEIEAALQQHPAVSEAVVTATGQTRSHQHLVAYVVPETEIIFEPESLALAQTQTRWDALLEQGYRQAQQPFWEIDLESFSTLWQGLDLLYLKATGKALLKLNIFQTPGEQYDLDQVMSHSQIVPRYRKWIARALRSLAEQGWLHQNEQRFESTDALLALADEELAIEFSAEQMQKLGLNALELNVPLEAARKLSEVLTEQIHSAQVYASAETSLLYQKMFPYCNAIASEVIAGLAQSLPPGESLRILEVGAGLGSTTRHVLPLLPPEQTSYIFSDISSYFFQTAREDFAATYPFVEYRLFDLEQEPQLQGYELHSFDVVIASSVLHVPRRVEESLGHVHSLLAPHGILLMIEETRFHPLYDLSMGLQQGFDRFEDEGLRPQHPLLSRDQWQELLAQAGFEQSVVLHQPGSVADWIGLDVLLAQGAAVTPGLKPEVLRRYLHQKLPDYMVPATFVMLEALPLSSNGKVDRQALPAPDTAGLNPAKSFVAPRTRLEAQLAELWAAVLGLERLGIHDNFFEIGGDSLLATRLLSQLREKLALELPLRSLFEEPTVAGLARHIEVLQMVATELQVTTANMSVGDREEGRL